MMRKFVCASLATATLFLMPARPAAAQAPAATPAAAATPAPSATPAPAAAQAPAEASDPNPGPISFTGHLDALPGTPYIFRGILQEANPKLTLWPAADIGISVYSGEKR